MGLTIAELVAVLQCLQLQVCRLNYRLRRICSVEAIDCAGVELGVRYGAKDPIVAQ